MVVYEGHRSVKGEYLYNQVDKNLNFQKHTHCNYEIVFCLGGCLVCEVGNKNTSCTAAREYLSFPDIFILSAHPKKARIIFAFFQPILSPYFMKNKDEITFRHEVLV